MARVRYKGENYREKYGKNLYRFNRKSYTKVPYEFALKFYNNPDFEVIFEKWEQTPKQKKKEVKKEVKEKTTKKTKIGKIFKKKK